MIEVISAVARIVLGGVMPYPDLARRWRVRRTALALVSRAPFPGDDAVTGADLAQLALLRVLWLQRQTRRAVRSRQREAAVMLARSSMETSILGLWCLHSPDAVQILRAAQLRSMSSSLTAFLSATDIFPKELLQQALRALGVSKRDPNVRDMTKVIDKATGGGIEAELYERWYAPTSTYFVHANASSLYRHVKSGSRPVRRPSMPWARRSPVRVADASAGLLALAIAGPDAKPTQLLVSYARDHAGRVIPPMAVMLAKGAGRAFDVGRTISAVRNAVSVKAYLAGPAQADTVAERETRVRAMYDFAFNDPDIPVDAVQPLVEHLVHKIISEYFPGSYHEAAPGADSSTIGTA